MALLFLVLFVLPAPGCDDSAPPGPIGGLIFVIRTFPASDDADLEAIDHVEINTDMIEVIHSTTLNGPGQHFTVDTQPRTILVSNKERDRAIAQYEVPVGFIHQIRIFPAAVTIHLKIVNPLNFV